MSKTVLHSDFLLSLGCQLRLGLELGVPGLDSQSSQLAKRSEDWLTLALTTFFLPEGLTAPVETKSLGLYSDSAVLAARKRSMSCWVGILVEGVECKTISLVAFLMDFFL